MTFKKEISIDGVAAIVAAIAVIGFIEKMSYTQDNQSKVLEQHSIKIDSLTSSENSLADSVSVLAAVLQERTGKPVLVGNHGTPRSQDNN